MTLLFGGQTCEDKLFGKATIGGDSDHVADRRPLVVIEPDCSTSKHNDSFMRHLHDDVCG